MQTIWLICYRFFWIKVKIEVQSLLVHVLLPHTLYFIFSVLERPLKQN